MAGDKQTTLYTLFTLAQQHGMLWTGSGMMPANTKAATRADVNHIGSSLGLMTATPSDASVDEMVKLLRKKGEPVFEAVAAKGIGVFETLKGVAKLVLQELTKTG